MEWRHKKDEPSEMDADERKETDAIKQKLLHDATAFLVRIRGFEPPRYRYHTDLNRARLPIPPYPHIVVFSLADLRLLYYTISGNKCKDFFLKKSKNICHFFVFYFTQ